MQNYDAVPKFAIRVNAGRVGDRVIISAVSSNSYIGADTIQIDLGLCPNRYLELTEVDLETWLEEIRNRRRVISGEIGPTVQ